MFFEPFSEISIVAIVIILVFVVTIGLMALTNGNGDDY